MVDAVNFCLKVGVYDHNEWDDLASVKVLQALLIYWFDWRNYLQLLRATLIADLDGIEKEGLICWSTYLQ